MKKTIALFAMLLLMNQAFAQEVKEVTQAEKDAVAQDLEHEAETGKHDKKTKVLLNKVAKSLKESSQKIVIGVKALDDCKGNCENKTKAGIVVRNVGRSLGKASAWLTTTTSKPFLNAAGFFTGLFEKKDNKDVVALYQFFINHSKEMDDIYLEANTPQEMIELMLAKMEEIVEAKSHLILKDYLISLGVNREIPADLSDFELTDAELACIDMSKVSPDFINAHPEYQELKPIIGEVSQEELEDIIMSGYFDKSIGFDNYKAALPKIHEGAAAVVGQIFGPKVVLGIISKSLAGLYALPVIAADIGTGVSTAICMQKETQEKFAKDEDLGAFCSYVVNRSAYQLMKSRAKGYVAGKKARANIIEKRAARKEKRAARRAAKQAIRLLAH